MAVAGTPVVSDPVHTPGMQRVGVDGPGFRDPTGAVSPPRGAAASAAGRIRHESQVASMARRTPATFAKRQREMEKKRHAEDKRRRKAERKAAGPTLPEDEPPFEVCRPITDE